MMEVFYSKGSFCLGKMIEWSLSLHPHTLVWAVCFGIIGFGVVSLVYATFPPYNMYVVEKFTAYSYIMLHEQDESITVI